MSTWRPARSITTLLAEVNATAPNRSKLSDGIIGDPAHSSRVSDHNPNPAGVVRAVDITDDDEHGVDASALAEEIRQLGIRGGHPALGPGAYVISNGRIASATQDGQPWDWEPYPGSNPHDKHCHVSVATAAAGYDSTTPWGVMTEEDPMTDYAAQLDRIEAKLDQAAKRDQTRNQRVVKLLRKLRTQVKDDATVAEIEAILAEDDR
jgi:hypothetical protein